ncbi:hypothetical protein V6Z11_A12G135600 [Gossypium hirsutum]
MEYPFVAFYCIVQTVSSDSKSINLFCSFITIEIRCKVSYISSHLGCDLSSTRNLCISPPSSMKLYPAAFVMWPPFIIFLSFATPSHCPLDAYILERITQFPAFHG